MALLGRLRAPPPASEDASPALAEEELGRPGADPAPELGRLPPSLASEESAVLVA